MLKSFLFSFIVLFMIWGLYSCASISKAPVYRKNGKVYGKTRGLFRHRWWNYYERGISYANGAYFTEAEADFQAALKQRELDQRMARTYGMHFIDYFPHRELGIVYYFLGELEKARAELVNSIEQYPSAKARFYLDQVRKKIFKQLNISVPGPVISVTIDASQMEMWTAQDPVVISGEVADAYYVSDLIVHQNKIYIEGAEKRIIFNEKLELAQGDHHITIVAKNLMDRVKQKKLIIHVDRQGPQIIVDYETKPSINNSEIKYYIKGYAHDESGIQKIIIDGHEINYNREHEIEFEQNVLTQSQTLHVQALDYLGNTTHATINLEPDAGLQAQLWLASRTIGISNLDKIAFFKQDRTPPEIHLADWTNSQIVYLEKIYFEGVLKDTSRVVSFFINDKPLLRRQGNQVFFSYFAKLHSGENKFKIVAKDSKGNQTEKLIKVIRKLPASLQLSERYKLAINPFENEKKIGDQGYNYLDRFLHALNQRKRFQIVEREKIREILRELELSQTKLIDEQTALKVGRLAAAQSIIAGSIVESRTGIEIVGRMIDVETSEIVAIEDVYDEDKNVEALRRLAEAMALKFHMGFPLLEGMIISLDGKSMMIDLGRDKLIKQRRIIVYKEIPITHPTTGKVLGMDHLILGNARVTEVLENSSHATLIKGNPEDLKPLIKIITE